MCQPYTFRWVVYSDGGGGGGGDAAAAESLVRGPQYWDRRGWDQDQLWRVPMLAARWLEVWAEAVDKVVSGAEWGANARDKGGGSKGRKEEGGGGGGGRRTWVGGDRVSDP